jgi:hypothetical protein
MDPLSNSPPVLVTVCATPSLFVHVIEVPAATVIVEGLNAIPLINTSFGPGVSDDFLQLIVMLIINKNNDTIVVNLFLPKDIFFITLLN